jgi:hypothetical protein
MIPKETHVRRIALSILLLLPVCAGCSPQVAVEIEPVGTRVLPVGAEAAIMIKIENITSQEIDFCDTYCSASVLVDGVEYERLPEYMGDCPVNDTLAETESMMTGLPLSEHGLDEEVLTTGSHTIAVRIGRAYSNEIVYIIKDPEYFNQWKKTKL